MAITSSSLTASIRWMISLDRRSARSTFPGARGSTCANGAFQAQQNVALELVLGAVSSSCGSGSCLEAAELRHDEVDELQGASAEVPA